SASGRRRPLPTTREATSACWDCRSRRGSASKDSTRVEASSASQEWLGQKLERDFKNPPRQFNSAPAARERAGTLCYALQPAQAVPTDCGCAQSSFTIVAVATPRSIVAPTALESFTVKVSVGSRLRSVMIEMEIVRLVWPGWNVSLPLAAV